MNAFVKALTGQAILTNQRDILVCLEFLTQLAPAALWGEAMHIAGLFSHIVNLLNAEEVSNLEIKCKVPLLIIYRARRFCSPNASICLRGLPWLTGRCSCSLYRQHHRPPVSPKLKPGK